MRNKIAVVNVYGVEFPGMKSFERYLEMDNYLGKILVCGNSTLYKPDFLELGKKIEKILTCRLTKPKAWKVFWLIAKNAYDCLIFNSNRLTLPEHFENLYYLAITLLSKIGLKPPKT